MSVDSQTRRTTQFTLRTLLLAILILAVTIANWRNLLIFASGLFWLSTITIVGASFAFGRWSQSAVLPDSRGLIARSICHALLIVCCVCSVFIIWSRFRWFASFDDPLWPQHFPYPDTMLLAFHDWLDARYPAPRDSFKIHGEFYTVLFILNGAVWISCSLFAFQLGVLVRCTIASFGFRWWRDKMVALTRKAT